MGRTRAIATDQTNFDTSGIEWTPGFRAIYSLQDPGFGGGNGHPGLGTYNDALDYVPVSLPFSIDFGGLSDFGINIWGLGFVSFGEVSLAERHFMQAFSDNSSLEFYPGRLLSSTQFPSTAQTFRVDVGIRDFFPTVTVDPFSFGQATITYDRSNAIPVSYIDWDGRTFILSGSGLYLSDVFATSVNNFTPVAGPPVDAVVGSGANEILLAGQSDSGDYNAETIVKPRLKPSRLETAISLDGFFDFQSDPTVTSSTEIPHASVRAGYSGREFYSFTVPDGFVSATFDIDGSKDIDTILALYDSAGNFIDGGDFFPGWDDAPIDAGSATTLDTFVSTSFPGAGRYFLEVAAVGGVSTSSSAYTLHVSLERAILTTEFGAQGGVVDAGGGNDTLVSSRGGDILDGGLGADGASFANATRGVTADIALGAAQGDGQDVLLRIENLTGSAFADLLRGDANANILRGGGGDDALFGLAGDDVLLGGSGNDTLEGEDGRDSLVGEAGDDTLMGGAGPNEMQGGIGNDVFVIVNGTDSTIELANEGTDEVRTALSVYTLQNNVENLTFTDNGPHQAGVGNALDNIIRGGTGRDDLFGRAGNDTLIDGGGTPGNEDTLLGGTGNDVYVVGLRGSSTVELANEGTDEVRTTFSIYSLQNNVENLTFTDNATHQAGVGNALANVIKGGTGRDELFGRAGDDTLHGGAGAANLLMGDAGNDTYVVEAAGDSVFERAGEGVDTVRTSLGTYTMSANIEQLSFTGTGAFTGVGNGAGNVIRGGTADDTLSGLEGDDVLVGGAGADLLIGGAGPDQFHYAGGETGLDRILDFAPGIDKLMLSASGFMRTANLAFVAGTAAISTNSTFLYNPQNGIVSYDRDGTGGAQAVQLAQLNAGLAVSITDFGFFGVSPNSSMISEIGDIAFEPWQIALSGSHWAIG